MMGIELKFLTDDPEEIEIAQRYWALNPNGKFSGTVKSLLPFRGARNTHDLLLLVRNYATAVCTMNPCATCGALSEINSRSEYTEAAEGKTCRQCTAIESRKLLRELSERSAAKGRLILARAQNLSKIRTNYQEVPDDIRLILLTLQCLLSYDPFEKSFQLNDCRNLNYLYHGTIDRLVKHGCLRDDPTTSSESDYEMKEDHVRPIPDRVRYILNPSTDLPPEFDSPWHAISGRPITDPVAVYELWRRFALGDAIQYLDNGCVQRSILLNEDQNLNIFLAIFDSLNALSVSQVWCVIWRSVKAAETMISKGYSRPKAADKIAADIPRELEKAVTDPSQIAQWRRPASHLAGALGDTFRELLMIDENTTGREVLACLNPTAINSDTERSSLAPYFMKRALITNNPLDALNEFAELIRAGLSAEDALLKLVGHEADALTAEDTDEHQA